jgi:broad specificity phosphatase PhoE
MPTTLIIVRHGQTSWNKDERFRGQTDVPLDETGLWQAEAVGRYIAAQYRPVAVFSSPLKRAAQTAEAIARALGLEAENHHGLLDLNFGDLAGLTIPDAQAKYPAVCRAWFSAPQSTRFPNGESLADVRTRAMAFVGEVVARFGGSQVVLVSHQVVCRVLFCALLDLDDGWFWRLRLDTASVTTFVVDEGRPVLTLANDTCHLHIHGRSEVSG